MASSRINVAAAVLGLLASGCAAAASAEEPASCVELREAWEEAGGPSANYAVQVWTVEQVTQLVGASDLTLFYSFSCNVLFDDAYSAASCSAPDIPPAFRSC